LSGLLKTKDLVNILKTNDPSGERIIRLRIQDIGDNDGDYLFAGELIADGVDASLKNGQQTCAGDSDVLRLTFRVDE